MPRPSAPGRARLRRPRRRPAVPRRAQHHAFRRAGHRRRAQAGHDLHHRADDQSRPAARQNPERRLDRGDARPHALGAGRALDRHHRDRPRDLHRLAARACSTRSHAARASRWPNRPSRPRTVWPRSPARPYASAIATGCASASTRWAPKPSPTPSCSRPCCISRCRARTPRRSPSSLLKRVRLVLGCAGGAARAARRVRRGWARSRVTNLKVIQARGPAFCARQGRPRAADPQLMVGADRLLPLGDGVRGHRAVPHPVPRQEEPADRRRGAAEAARSTTRRSIRAR